MSLLLRLLKGPRDPSTSYASQTTAQNDMLLFFTQNTNEKRNDPWLCSFKLQSRVISVRSWYLTSLVNPAFCRFCLPAHDVLSLSDDILLLSFMQSRLYPKNSFFVFQHFASCRCYVFCAWTSSLESWSIFLWEILFMCLALLLTHYMLSQEILNQILRSVTCTSVSPLCVYNVTQVFCFCKPQYCTKYTYLFHALCWFLEVLTTPCWHLIGYLLE